MKMIAMLDYSLVAQEREQELKLLVRLKAPAGARIQRKPLNLGVVIDRSGSMAGEKIEQTKQALKTLITHLGPEDVLSLVQFDDAAQTLLEPMVVTDKDAFRQLVDRIGTGGSTNLSAGWLQGLKLIGRNASADRISRCLLLTDGQANVGIQDPHRLAFLGRSARQKYGITTTTLGFGEGFNEDLLTAIAREAGGAFYYVDQADQAPAIFSEELHGLLQLAAQNIEVTLLAEAPVTMVAQWTDYPAQVKAGAVVFSLGDAYAGEEKNLLVSLLVPGLKRSGAALVARLETSYVEIGAVDAVTCTIRQAVHAHVADAAQAGTQGPEVDVQQQYGLQLAARARRQAMQEADEGDFGKAERTLRMSVRFIADLPDPGGLLRGEIEELLAQAQRFDAATYSHDRKVLCEDTFAASSGNYGRVRAARARRQAKVQRKADATQT